MRYSFVVLLVLVVCEAAQREAALSRSKRAITVDDNRLWPNGVVPYRIGSAITSKVNDLIMRAFAEWQNKTCIRFVPRQKEKNFVLFNVSECGCCSSVGRRGGEQMLSLAEFCVDQAVAIHEIGHSLGFYHEQSRPDRDNYVNIFLDNAVRDKRHNFRKLPHNESRWLDQPYDYRSIMHYREKTFSMSKQTVLAARRSDIALSNKAGLSPGDVAETMLLYNCSYPPCDHVLSGANGEFYSPYFPAYYLPNMNCSWLITSETDEYIFLEFLHFDVAGSRNCTNDSVKLFELHGAKWRPLVTLCNEVYSYEHDPPGSPLTIHEGMQMRFYSFRPLMVTFRSDATIAKSGFHATYKRMPVTPQALRDLNEQEMLHLDSNREPETAEIWGSGSGESEKEDSISEESSGATEHASIVSERHNIPRFLYKPKNCWKYITERRGSIESPLVPVGYGSEIRCQWFIENEENQHISFNLEELSHDGKCSFNLYTKSTEELNLDDRIVWLSLPWIDGDDAAAIYNFNGYSVNCSAPIVLQSKGILLTWSSKNHRSFRMTFHPKLDECKENIHLCSYKCEDLDDGYKCLCPTGAEYRPHAVTRNMAYANVERHREALLRQHCPEKTIERSHHCGAVLIKSRGVIRASTEIRQNCTWSFSYATLDLPSNYALVLIFNSFRVLPAGSNCPEASLDFVVGRLRRGTFCGIGLPRINSYYDLSLTLNLRLSESFVKAGHSSNFFSLRYLVVNRSATAKSLRAASVRVGKSPVFLENERENGSYLPNAYYSWKLTTLRDRGTLDCRFLEMDIEYTVECYFDYVEIASRPGVTITGRLCGSQSTPGASFSVNNNAIITFASDETVVRKGFRLQCVANYGD